MLWAEAWLLDQIEATNAARRSPPHDPSLDAGFVCYNTTLQTCCYDFTPWLVDAEMRRRAAGAPAPLKIGFVSGLTGELCFYTPAQETMFHNVVRPMLAFVAAVEDERAKHGRAQLVQGY